MNNKLKKKTKKQNTAINKSSGNSITSLHTFSSSRKKLHRRNIARCLGLRGYSSFRKKLRDYGARETRDPKIIFARWTRTIMLVRQTRDVGKVTRSKVG